MTPLVTAGSSLLDPSTVAGSSTFRGFVGGTPTPEGDEPHPHGGRRVGAAALVRSDDRRDLVAGGADPALGGGPQEQRAAEDEEDDEREDRRPVGVGQLEDQ